MTHANKTSRRETEKAWRFASLELENWRNFGRMAVTLERRVFLVGPNASGKSNLLDAFRFLHDMVSVGSGFQEAVRRRRGVSSLRALSARKYSDILVAVTVNANGGQEWRYHLKFSQDTQRRAVIKEERVFRGRERLLGRRGGPLRHGGQGRGTRGAGRPRQNGPPLRRERGAAQPGEAHQPRLVSTQGGRHR